MRRSSNIEFQMPNSKHRHVGSDDNRNPYNNILNNVSINSGGEFSSNTSTTPSQDQPNLFSVPGKDIYLPQGNNRHFGDIPLKNEESNIMQQSDMHTNRFNEFPNRQDFNFSQFDPNYGQIKSEDNYQVNSQVGNSTSDNISQLTRTQMGSDNISHMARNQTEGQLSSRLQLSGSRYSGHRPPHPNYLNQVPLPDRSYDSHATVGQNIYLTQDPRKLSMSDHYTPSLRSNNTPSDHTDYIGMKQKTNDFIFTTHDSQTSPASLRFPAPPLSLPSASQSTSVSSKAPPGHFTPHHGHLKMPNVQRMDTLQMPKNAQNMHASFQVSSPITGIQSSSMSSHVPSVSFHHPHLVPNNSHTISKQNEQLAPTPSQHSGLRISNPISNADQFVKTCHSDNVTQIGAVSEEREPCKPPDLSYVFADEATSSFSSPSSYRTISLLDRLIPFHKCYKQKLESQNDEKESAEAEVIRKQERRRRLIELGHHTILVRSKVVDPDIPLFAKLGCMRKAVFLQALYFQQLQRELNLTHYKLQMVLQRVYRQQQDQRPVTS